jgi:hypothetical protein
MRLRGNESRAERGVHAASISAHPAAFERQNIILNEAA